MCQAPAARDLRRRDRRTTGHHIVNQNDLPAGKLRHLQQVNLKCVFDVAQARRRAGLSLLVRLSRTHEI
jgi:hypothetical protein